MQPVQKCGLLSVYSNSQVLVRGAFLWEYFSTAMLSGARRVVSTSEHFEPLQSTVYSHFMDRLCRHVAVLGLGELQGGFVSCSMAKAIKQGQTYQDWSHVPAPSLLCDC